MPEPGPGIRLRVPLGFSIPRRLTAAGYAVVGAPPTRRTVELFDTGDRRLAAAGAELSFTRADGWLWRRDPLGHPKLSVREWSAPATSPQTVVDEWSRAYRRGRPLGRRASVRVHRRVLRVTAPQADTAFALLEERVDEQRGELWAPRLRRLTVSDGANTPAVCDVLDDALLDDAATLALLRPSLVRAAPLRLPAGRANGVRDLFLRSTTLSLIQWVYFDCELSAGSADALRKLRVALRRLRSDVQTFGPVLDREWADGLRGQIGTLAARLGTVRDAETLAGRIAGLVTSLPDEDRPSALPLVEGAAVQLAAERGELLDELSQPAYVALLDATLAAFGDPRWAGDADQDPAVTRLAARPWRRLRRYVAAIDGIPDDDQLHRIRILAKRARYAADAAVPTAGEAAVDAAASLAALQTVLGEHHDAAVTREWLRRRAQTAPGIAFGAGLLSALELGRQREAAERWPGSWAAAARGRGWRWLNG